MRVVYRYLLTHKCTDVFMYKGNVVMVGMQGDEVCLWAEVDPDSEEEMRRFRIYPTGEQVNDGDVYVGTFFKELYMLSHKLVFHIYEEVLE